MPRLLAEPDRVLYVIRLGIIFLSILGNYNKKQQFEHTSIFITTHTLHGKSSYLPR